MPSAGVLRGIQVERISILLYPTSNDVDDTKNSIIKINTKVTESLGGGQRFEAQLQAVVELSTS